MHSGSMGCLLESEEVEEGTSVGRIKSWRDCKKKKEALEPQELRPFFWATELCPLRSKMCGKKKQNLLRAELLHTANSPRFQRTNQRQLVEKQICEKARKTFLKICSGPTQLNQASSGCQAQGCPRCRPPCTPITDTVSVRRLFFQELGNRSAHWRNGAHNKKIY